jgi:hypothetical protein
LLGVPSGIVSCLVVCGCKSVGQPQDHAASLRAAVSQKRFEPHAGKLDRPIVTPCLALGAGARQ